MCDYGWCYRYRVSQFDVSGAYMDNIAVTVFCIDIGFIHYLLLPILQWWKQTKGVV